MYPSRRWNTFRTAFETAVGRAKLQNFHFHDLRHTFASWAVQSGATPQEVKDLLGHASLAMVMRYAHLSPENLRVAVSRLDAKLPAETAARITDGITDGVFQALRCSVSA